MDSELSVQISVLGGFRLVLGDRQVPQTAFQTRKALTLMKLLAIKPGFRLHRDQALDTLWPDLDPQQAAAQLYKSIHYARKALDARQVDSAMSFYADDASVLGPNAPVMTGKEAIRKFWSDQFAPTVDLKLSCRTFRVEVAHSGDLGYGQGTYEASFKDLNGNQVKDRGKYVVLWKKQSDGKWKVIADTYNSDLPFPTPPAK